MTDNHHPAAPEETLETLVRSGRSDLADAYVARFEEELKAKEAADALAAKEEHEGLSASELLRRGYDESVPDGHAARKRKQWARESGEAA